MGGRGVRGVGAANLLDRVQVAGVGREVEDLGADGLDELLENALLVVMQSGVVADQNAVVLGVGPQVGQHRLHEGGEEAGGVHRLGHQVGGRGGARQLRDFPAQHPCAQALTA